MHSFRIIFLLWIIALVSCQSNTKVDETKLPKKNKEPNAISLFQEPLFSPEPGAQLVEQLYAKKKAYLEDTTSLTNLIWYGRFLAYAGNYKEAINLYSKGIAQFPDEPRLYRHRGHRYISMRAFDWAIKDFEKAKTLIIGKEDKIEPDGMPNEKNIPLSTLHSNIYYHLGLAYYLKGAYPRAAEAYKKCKALGLNDDNRVSSSYWLYLIYRHLDKEDFAKRALNDITESMSIIENDSYHKLCLFFKGKISESELMNHQGDAPASDAIIYGLSTWFRLAGNISAADHLQERLLANTSWNSFGYISAEADKLRLGAKAH